MKLSIDFYLLEEVTPELFLSKVALALALGGAIREEESIAVETLVLTLRGTDSVELGADVIPVPHFVEKHISKRTVDFSQIPEPEKDPFGFIPPPGCDEYGSLE